MTRTVTPLSVPDLSNFARALGRSLRAFEAERGALPAHQSLLNLIARAAGHRNLQSLQAGATPLPRLRPAAEDRPPPEPLTSNARKALTQFDERGRLVRMPSKRSVRHLTLWVLWMQFDGRRVYSEREVNELLKACHTYGDHVTLRRELIDNQLLTRRRDGAEYQKLPARPDAEAHALMTAWRALVPRRGSSAGKG
jgi:hypothetical protein